MWSSDNTQIRGQRRYPTGPGVTMNNELRPGGQRWCYWQLVGSLKGVEPLERLEAASSSQDVQSPQVGMEAPKVKILCGRM